MSSSPPDDIRSVLPPWQLKGTIYSFMTWVTSKEAKALADDPFLYAPLEHDSTFKQGRFLGGLAMVQVIRYSESPVGPYDELLVVPGKFEHEVEVEKKGEKVLQKQKHLRLTRIYVSQKYTCWNGRANWNIPKHLARFTFEDLPKNAVRISVYPHVTDSTDVESLPSSTSCFTAVFKPTRYIPAIPMSTSIAKYVGLDLSIAQPPLPEGKGALMELPGTKEWCGLMPGEYSSKTSVGRWDLKQDAGDEEYGTGPRSHGEAKVYENFWPGMGRRRMGFILKDAVVDFPAGTYWTGVRTT